MSHEGHQDNLVIKAMSRGIISVVRCHVRTTIAAGGTSLIGAVTYGTIKGWGVVWDELLVSAAYTLGPAAVVILLVVLWNLWLAPMRVVLDRVDALSDRVSQLEPSAPRPVPPDYALWRNLESAAIVEIAGLCAGQHPQLSASPGAVPYVRHILDGVKAKKIGRTDGRIVPTRRGISRETWSDLNDLSKVRIADVEAYFSERGIKSAFFDFFPPNGHVLDTEIKS